MRNLQVWYTPAIFKTEACWSSRAALGEIIMSLILTLGSTTLNTSGKLCTNVFSLKVGTWSCQYSAQYHAVLQNELTL